MFEAKAIAGINMVKREVMCDFLGTVRKPGKQGHGNGTAREMAVWQTV